METFNVVRVSAETFKVNGNEYYIEYIRSDFYSRLSYRIININNTTPRRMPVNFQTDYKMRVRHTQWKRFTLEEAAVCRKKGMIVADHFIQRPSIGFITRILFAVKYVINLFDRRMVQFQRR